MTRLTTIVNMNTNERLVPVKVPFGTTEFLSVRFDGVDYYPISELPKDANGNSGFPVLQNNEARDLKAILGKASQSFNFTELATTLNPRKIKCVTHDELSLLVKHYARKKDSEFCWELLEASFNTELKRANDHARGQLQAEEYYQEWLAERSAGIRRRREFTDCVKMWKELGHNLDYAILTIEVYRYTNLLEKYYAWKKVYTEPSLKNKNPFRGTLNSLELYELSCCEHLIAQVSNKRKITPEQSILWIKANI